MDKYKTVIQYKTFKIIYLAAILLSCTSTKQTIPNISITDPAYKPPNQICIDENFNIVKRMLTELSVRNNELANEIGKLPDLQDGICINEIEAIVKIIKLDDLSQELMKKFLDNTRKI